MENTTNAKSIIAVITAVLSYILGCVTELIVVLVFLMIFDYITGIMAAYVRKEISSNKGIVGIFKKFSFLLLVILGFFFDYVVTYLVSRTGLNFTTMGAVGIATCCWLIGTEAISITENLSEIGVPIPPFLKKAFEKLKEKSEEATAAGSGKGDG